MDLDRQSKTIIFESLLTMHFWLECHFFEPVGAVAKMDLALNQIIITKFNHVLIRDMHCSIKQVILTHL